MSRITGLISVDPNSPVPLYFQVAQHLERAIESGQIAAGDRLDNEIQLAQQLGLSRPTVRQALQYLVDKGLLVRKRGVGTQVVQAKFRRPIELTSLYEDLAGSGQQPTTTVLANTVEPADGTVAKALGVAEGTEVIVLRRLRFAHDEPIARLTNYLPPGLVELTTPALEQQGLYQLLRAQGVRPHAAIQAIGARTATSAEGRLLHETKGAALLTMERTAYDGHDRAIEYGSHIYRASRYSFALNLRAH
ncbi:MAG TPA: GntR family transcriptional regulator [Pseudonocardiaceae bacterium]|jgi:DNA-binding GntR family transcriptional regulator|nr:GntR family transcriptional regulator [Pseudonocardiaceae bacterium]